MKDERLIRCADYVLTLLCSSHKYHEKEKNLAELTTSLVMYNINQNILLTLDKFRSGTS